MTVELWREDPEGDPKLRTHCVHRLLCRGHGPVNACLAMIPPQAQSVITLVTAPGFWDLRPSANDCPSPRTSAALYNDSMKTQVSCRSLFCRAPANEDDHLVNVLESKRGDS